MENKKIQKDLFLDIIIWFTLICIVIICTSVCTYKYNKAMANDKIIDSIPLKITYHYDSTKWEVLPMTHKDSLFIKSITTNGIKRLSKRNSKKL